MDIKSDATRTELTTCFIKHHKLTKTYRALYATKKLLRVIANLNGIFYAPQKKFKIA